jgi:hypothetical protein
MAEKSKRRAWTTSDVRTLKVLAKKKKPSAEYRPNLKAEWGSDATKGIQHRVVARFASLK